MTLVMACITKFLVEYPFLAMYTIAIVKCEQIFSCYCEVIETLAWTMDDDICPRRIT